MRLGMINNNMLNIQSRRAETAFIARQRLRVKTVGSQCQARLGTNIPSLHGLFFTIVGGFTACRTPNIEAQRAKNGTAIVRGNVTIFTALFRRIHFATALTARRLMVAFPSINVFNIRVHPTFQPFRSRLIVIMVSVARHVGNACQLQLS